jgi:hypothetical protein
MIDFSLTKSRQRSQQKTTRGIAPAGGLAEM